MGVARKKPRRPLTTVIKKGKRVRHTHNHLKGVCTEEAKPRMQSALLDFELAEFSKMCKDLKPISDEELNALVDKEVEKGTLHGEKWEKSPYAPVRATDIHDNAMRWPFTFKDAMNIE